jgi:hypothetical protein
MKKILLLLIIAPVLGYGQVLTDVKYVYAYYPSLVSSVYNIPNSQYGRPFITDGHTLLTVPNDKVWEIKYLLSRNKGSDGFDYRWYQPSDYQLVFVDEKDNKTIDGNEWFYNTVGVNVNVTTKSMIENKLLIPSGTNFMIQVENNESINQDTEVKIKMLIYEYSLSSGSSLSFNNNVESQDRVVLYPNPTSSLLALNSDNEYDIEVYDMAGNKVMSLTGNNINMEHLSTATYIVKATDKSNNEELTYKVVKN